MIDLQRLIACGVAPNIARAFVEPLRAACERFNISSLEQQAGFIAQAMHESSHLAKLEESLWYSTPQNILRSFTRLQSLPITNLRALVKNPKGLALAAYSGVNGNGGPATMDGWTYRGAGPFQLTGRGNFQEFQDATRVQAVDKPELLRVPGTEAALSAGWYWASHRCNDMMAHGDIDGTTRAINGARMLGAMERRELYSHCKDALV